MKNTNKLMFLRLLVFILGFSMLVGGLASRSKQVKNIISQTKKF